MNTTIGSFLSKIKKELSPDHPELRTISDDGLIYVVFDTIIPNVKRFMKHLSFFDIINNNVDDKNRPLFIIKETQNLKSKDGIYEFLQNQVTRLIRSSSRRRSC